jgi:hypothetical protein
LKIIKKLTNLLFAKKQPSFRFHPGLPWQRIGGIILLTIFSLSSFSCQSTLDLLQNIQRLKFKLGNINQFSLAGINISGKRSISDFSITDGIRLAEAFAGRNLPAAFTLNVLAKNPNDGTGGSVRTTSTLTKFDWNLLINEKPTVNGSITEQIVVPGIGQETVIPVRIGLDLYSFFSNLGYDGLMNLALTLGGVNGSTTNVKLRATPYIETSFGPLSPGEITIVDTEFR